MNNLGLDYKEIKNIIKGHLDKNADLIIGLDDPELTQLVDVICEGVAIAIEANNEHVGSQIESANRELGFRLR